MSGEHGARDGVLTLCSQVLSRSPRDSSAFVCDGRGVRVRRAHRALDIEPRRRIVVRRAGSRDRAETTYRGAAGGGQTQVCKGRTVARTKHAVSATAHAVATRYSRCPQCAAHTWLLSARAWPGRCESEADTAPTRGRHTAGGAGAGRGRAGRDEAGVVGAGAEARARIGARVCGGRNGRCAEGRSAGDATAAAECVRACT